MNQAAGSCSVTTPCLLNSFPSVLHGGDSLSVRRLRGCPKRMMCFPSLMWGRISITLMIIRTETVALHRPFAVNSRIQCVDCWLFSNCCTFDETHVGEVRFEVQLWKAPELVFLVKWVSYQGARGFGWTRRRSRRYPVKAVIRTASPRCSNGGDPKERRWHPGCKREFLFHVVSGNGRPIERCLEFR